MKKNEEEAGEERTISELSIANCFPISGESILPPPPPEVGEEKGVPYSANGWRLQPKRKNHKH